MQASEAAAPLRDIGHITNCFSAGLRQNMAALQRPEPTLFLRYQWRHARGCAGHAQARPIYDSQLV